jgi:hypothetical protein
MVEPPCRSPVTVWKTAAAVRLKSMPWWSKKRWSSAAIRASTMDGEMRGSLTHSRFKRLKVASSLPSAERSTAGYSAFTFRRSRVLGVSGISTSTQISSDAAIVPNSATRPSAA